MVEIVKGVYEHYKGGHYSVIGIATHEKSEGDAYRHIGFARHSEIIEEEIAVFRDINIPDSDMGLWIPNRGACDLVVYKSLYDSDEFPRDTLWARSKEVFLGDTVVNGREVPRFKLIEKI